jgi:hypothetical protein
LLNNNKNQSIQAFPCANIRKVLEYVNTKQNKRADLHGETNKRTKRMIDGCFYVDQVSWDFFNEGSD